MKLATFRAPGVTQPLAGEVIGDEVKAFASDLTVVDVLCGAAPRVPGAGSWPLSDVELLPPVPDPGTIYAIGLNYAKHIQETGGQKPETPIVFVKVRASVAAPGGPIVCPAVVRRLDYEGELALVIGTGGRHIPASEAEQHVFGYTIANDVTIRDWQRRGQQFLGHHADV